MKVKKSITNSKGTLVSILAMLLVVLFVSCTKKVSFLTSSVVPAARGTVKIDQDKNKNYVINIELQNLAESSRLTPPKKTYVVWVTSEKNMTKNVGQIDTSSKSFSKNLTASFQSISVDKPTKIYITAEDDPGVQYTMGQVVLTTGSL